MNPAQTAILIQQTDATRGAPQWVDRYGLEEPFEKAPTLAANLDPGTVNQAALRLYTVANKSFELAGVGTPTATLTDGGGAILTTTNSSADTAVVQPLSNINSVAATAWRAAGLGATARSPIFGFSITTGASVASVFYKAGLSLTNAMDLGTDNDQVFVYYDSSDGSGTWKVGVSIGGVDTIISPVAGDTYWNVAADTHWSFQIRIGSDRRAVVYGTKDVNGEWRAFGSTTVGGSATGVLTSATLLPFIGVKTLTTAAKTLLVRRCSLSIPVR